MPGFFITIAADYRIRFLSRLAVVFLAANAVLRLALSAAFQADLPPSASMAAGFAKGAANDLAALSFAFLVPCALMLLPTAKFIRSKIGVVYAAATAFAFSAFAVFTSFAEYFFWEEFGCRFNFIAVDYLVYTTELMDNAIESYPLGSVLAGVAAFSLGATEFVRTGIRGKRAAPEGGNSISCEARLGVRLGALGALCLAATVTFFWFSPFGNERDRQWNEFAKNGLYELFSAYLGNQLDYRAFYMTIDSGEAFKVALSEISGASASGGLDTGRPPLRGPADSGAGFPVPRPNVVIVLMESMGSSWLGELTPSLNALASQGISFGRMMSTGTRTVRGIEAVMLSVPPTPGNSIVRRADNGGLFTLGTPFRIRGYSLDFVYGGVGFFDNMNAFFEGNGYRITDKLDFSKGNRTFANAWGQCDEDMYSESLRLADLSRENGVPFHQVLLTTSNHRPFTFPEGKIGMEQGSREAAVRYSDFAIGEYIQKASLKPWFDDTVFVFVGDHPSSIAGKTEVPPDAYGIVSVIYGPKFFAPKKVDTLSSQIDIGPTLLAAIGWGYRSWFFGADARSLPRKSGRAWISTYQLLGFRTLDRLAVLKPDGSAEVTRLGEAGETDGGDGQELFKDDDVV
ncbi:MAG: LTA synthase family protein, partial [Deltaproteobacteria bacterium]|nr:LTA synthase family protein [Deltaproteobacteria bacterium]